eukprot:2225525-Alexandrium_andersonii.AAC.1
MADSPYVQGLGPSTAASQRVTCSRRYFDTAAFRVCTLDMPLKYFQKAPDNPGEPWIAPESRGE